jgi:pimeloyl-ACP methyl ester carboxylesterase
MIRVWLKRIALALVALLGVFVFGFVPYYLGGIATRSRFPYNDKENADLTPASFQLAYEDVSFRSSDGTELEGWWVPASSPRGSVVMVHGLNRSRIEMVRRVPFAHERGWSVVLLDLRHHGASGGEVTSFGVREKEDVRAAARFARERAPGPVVLWGVSLGAASAVLAAAEDADVKGIICDSSYRSLDDTVRHHLVLFRGFRWWLRIVPTWPTTDLVMFWIGRRGGFDPSQADVLAAARQLHGRPTLFVANSDDRRMPKEIAFDLKAAAGDQASVLIVPGRSHGGAWRDGTEAYQAAAAVVLDAVASAATPAGAAAVASR